MTQLKQAAQQALEALQNASVAVYAHGGIAAVGSLNTAAQNLRAALAEPPPQRKPLTVTDLQEALVYANLIDRDAIDDPDNYDEGSTMAQIDELHRIIEREHGIGESNV